MFLQDFKTLRQWQSFIIRSFACLGVVGTVLQTTNVINPDITFFQGPYTLVAVVLLSIFVGLIMSWPRPITQDYSSPRTRISIVEGDILSQPTHIVIGTNDTFDTETPVIIDGKSLQGQALRRLYGDDRVELDRQLDAALLGKAIVGTVNKLGKTSRYGIGAIATLIHSPRLIFFLAYCEMDANNNASSTPDKVWKSLILLWDEVSRRGNGGALAIPVIGGGHARLSSVVPAQDAIRLLALSFMFASRESRICEELRIVVQRSEYQKLDRLELQAFLSSLS